MTYFAICVKWIVIRNYPDLYFGRLDTINVSGLFLKMTKTVEKFFL